MRLRCLCGGKVAAEGLLDDDAAPAVALVRHAAGAHVAKSDLVERGRYREVVEPVGDAIEPALELGTRSSVSSSRSSRLSRLPVT